MKLVVSYPMPAGRQELSVVRKEIFLCLLSAILLIISFPKFNLEFLAWVGFVPLFFALRNKSKVKAFLLSFFTGVIFWLGIIYWLVHVTFGGMILLVIYLAVYFGIFGLIVSVFSLQSSAFSLLFLPSAWVILEYIRSYLFTGFPWALLGYSQYLNLPIIQLADITGAWGVSFLVMLVNAGIYSVVSCPMPAGRQELSVVSQKQKFLLPILCLLASLIYGHFKLHQTPNTKDQTPIKISVIQGNIPQELKWQSFSRQFILGRYMQLSQEAVSFSPDLIIWPEASSPGILGEDAEIVKGIFDFAQLLSKYLLIGTVVKEGALYFNSAVLIDKQGKLIQRYDKLHLVPFGEYVPLGRILGFLQTVVPIGDFTGGRDYTVFKIPNSKFQIQNRFSVLICFEDIFPEISRRFTQRGAEFLVNITNDAWFGKTAASYQHLQASVFRAVENRLFLVRCANTGFSGFISPEGRVISRVVDSKGEDIFIAGFDTQDISVRNRPTFYTRYGDAFVLLVFISALYGIILKNNYCKG
jgi:apolipoprotein N-acyltransferase